MQRLDGSILRFRIGLTQIEAYRFCAWIGYAAIVWVQFSIQNWTDRFRVSPFYDSKLDSYKCGILILCTELVCDDQTGPFYDSELDRASWRLLLHKREDRRFEFLEFFIEHSLLSSKPGIYVGMKSRAVVHVDCVCEFMKHDQLLEVQWQQQREE